MVVPKDFLTFKNFTSILLGNQKWLVAAIGGKLNEIKASKNG